MLNKNRDRRTHERTKADWEYLFAIEVSHKGKKTISEVKDISCGGLMCKLNQNIQPGKELKIAFLIPGYTKSGIRFHRIENTGLVVRCEHFPEVHDMSCHRLGIAFQNLSKKDKAVIEKFVSYARGVEKTLEKKSTKHTLHVEHNCVMTRF